MTTIGVQEKIDLYQKYLPMAWNLASHFSRGYHQSIQTLGEEAEEALGLAVAGWDRPGGYNDEKSSPCTWIYQAMYFHLLDYCTRDKHVKMPSLDICLEAGFHPRAAVDRIESLLKDLGDEAREVVQLVMNCPAEIADDLKITCRARAKQALRNFLSKRWLWSKEKIEKVWGEIEVCLA